MEFSLLGEKGEKRKNPLKPSRLGIVVKIANEVSKIVYLYILCIKLIVNTTTTYNKYNYYIHIINVFQLYQS